MRVLKVCAGVFLLLAIYAPLSVAQRGDKKGEEQTLRVPKDKIPPSPPLSPQEALKTFRLQPGFSIELVASEPMIEMPVALSFAPDGRLYVLEMRGFMPNPDGAGEHEPVGRVSVLEDVNGDGRMDKNTVFLDGLVMPRAICVVAGGVLVAEPPNLWHCIDTNKDLRCDVKKLVASDYGDQRNPEHTANGLLLARDNWIYSLYHTWRYRCDNGEWRREPTINRTQWGLAQDDFGRLFYTSNSDQLRGDLVPGHYLRSSPPKMKFSAINARIAQDQSVWPARVNPGVNRGYLKDVLRPDGTLSKVTAACGTGIYRGDALPSDVYGNAFVCEPSANVVKRNILQEKDGLITAHNAYDKAEFLTSTDERFRPVNTYTAPDGSLYIVDMYHGILQHRIYMTSYLRQQVEERGLDKPQTQGRIYRVVHSSKRPRKLEPLSNLAPRELISRLDHPNGWVRDTAQELLIRAADEETKSKLRQLALSKKKRARTRIHAVWVLEGLKAIDQPLITSLLSDHEPKIRVLAVRIAETAPGMNVAGLLPALRGETQPEVQTQLALTLGELRAKEQLADLAMVVKAPLAKEAVELSLSRLEPPKEAKPKTNQVAALTAADQKLFEAGKSVYELTCLACHQPHGQGQEGLAPPLVESEWVTGSEQRLIRIILNGVRGPIMVKNQKYDLDMPMLGVLDDEQIAGVLTYVRREWGHTAPPVSVETVKAVRQAVGNREDAWTEAELKKIP